MLYEMFNLSPSTAEAEPSIDALDPETRSMVEMAIAGRAHEEARAVVASLSKMFGDTWSDALDAAYVEMMPPAETRERHRQIFKTFREYCTDLGVDALPAHGAAIGCFLLDLALKKGGAPEEVCEARRAIEYYHALYAGAPYVTAAFKIMADKGGDDGGGIELEDGGSDAPVAQEAHPSPAAEVPQTI